MYYIDWSLSPERQDSLRRHSGRFLLIYQLNSNNLFMAHRVHCINKQDRNNQYERITHIGGQNDNGTNWKITQQDAINYIENGKYSFYVLKGGAKVNVIVSRSRFGNKYIKTEADYDEPNNLLELPECK